MDNYVFNICALILPSNNRMSCCLCDEITIRLQNNAMVNIYLGQKLSVRTYKLLCIVKSQLALPGKADAEIASVHVWELVYTHSGRRERASEVAWATRGFSTRRRRR